MIVAETLILSVQLGWQGVLGKVSEFTKANRRRDRERQKWETVLKAPCTQSLSLYNLHEDLNTQRAKQDHYRKGDLRMLFKQLIDFTHKTIKPASVLLLNHWSTKVDAMT